jgi:hypothetical protein
VIHNRRGGETCGSLSSERSSCHAGFPFLPALDKSGLDWRNSTRHRKSLGLGNRVSRFAFIGAPCLSAIPAHGIRWASKAAVPHRGVVHRRFRRIRINKKVATRPHDDEPPISGMTTGPKHSCHQLRRAERGNGLPLGKRQRTRPVERDAMRGRFSFLIHR